MIINRIVLLILVSFILFVGVAYSDYSDPEKYLQSSPQHQPWQFMDKNDRWFDSLNVRFIGNWPFGSPYAVATDTARDLVFLSCGGGVYIYDCTNPLIPIKLSETIHTRSRFAYDLFYDMSTQRLYTAGGWGTKNEICDVSNPSDPIKLGGWDAQYFSWEVFVSGSYAYVADGSAGLRIVNISDPSNPYEVSYNNTIGYAYHVVVSDSYAYVVSDSLFIFYVSDPANPYIVGHDSVRGFIAISDTFAYIAGSRLTILNISNPAAPYEVGYYNVSSDGILVSDSLVYLIYTIPPNMGGLRIVNVADPANPVEIGNCDSLGRSYGFGLLNSHVYRTATDLCRLQILDVANPSNPHEINYIFTPGLANSIFISEPYAYLGDLGGGLRIINIMDLTNPHEIGYCLTNDWVYEVEVRGNYAYLCNLHTGLRIINIIDPSNPYEVGNCDTPGWPYSIEIIDSFVYIADFDTIPSLGSGLRIINIADPSNPHEVGYYDTPGQACWISMADSLAFIADLYSLRIINVSNPINPVEIGHYNCEATSVDVQGDYAYIGSSSGLRIINISNPTNPFLVGTYNPAGLRIHSVEINGFFVYCASENYNWNLDRVLIIDVSDPANPQEAGFYETPDALAWVTVSGQYLFAADLYSGMQIYESNINNITEANDTPIYKNLRFLQNPITAGVINLEFQLPQSSRLNICIYNATGQKTKNYGETYYQAGMHRIKLPIKDLALGVYFLHIQINDTQMTKKILIIQ